MDRRSPGEQLRDRRNQLGLAQTDLKALEGPGHEAVSRWEADDIPAKPQARTLKAFEKALGLKSGSMQALLSGGDIVPLHNHRAPVPQRPLNTDDEWAVVPKWMVTRLVSYIAEVNILTRRESGEVSEIVSHAHTVAADMLALITAAERSTEDLTRLVERLEREP